GKALLDGDERRRGNGLHHLAGFGDFLRPAAAGGGTDDGFDGRLDEFGRAAFADEGDVLLTLSAGRMVVGLRFGAAEGQGFDASGDGSPDFVQGVAADGASGKEGFAEVEVVEETGGVGGELFNGDGGWRGIGAGFGLAVATEVGNDQLIFGRENFGNGEPEAV